MDKLREKPHVNKLYSKCLEREGPRAIIRRFEVVIKDHKDNLVFKTDGQLNDPNTMITSMEVEIRALLHGLAEATTLGIDHISIYLSRGLDLKKENIALLMDDLQRMRSSFQSSNLVRESLVSQIRRYLHLLTTKEAKKEFCNICFENFYPHFIFSVDMCGHRFCIICMKHYLEVKLLDGAVPKCPQHACKSTLSIDRCRKLLTPTLNLIWKQKIKEEKIPFTDRFYCPYRTCSYLMLKSELSTTNVGSGLRTCSKCGGFFCIHCKVPWHNNLSCTDYKKLHPNSKNEDVNLLSLSTLKGWRQCGKCHQMVERAFGCNHMTCRCGNEFCYGCGAEWNDSINHLNCGIRNERRNYSENERRRNLYNERKRNLLKLLCFVLVLMAFLYYAFLG